MRNRKVIYSFLLFTLAVNIILSFAIYSSKKMELKVVFLNVGQGDAIFISQGSNQIIIDSGKSGQILSEKLGKYVPFWDRKIETVVFTHPDQDHIGGFVDIFKNYKIETVLKTKAESDSKTFQVLEEFIDKEESEVIEAMHGVNIILQNGIELQVIYPFESVSEIQNDTNSSSVVAILNQGKTKFIFTGDLPHEKENEILQRSIDISADILKVSHHGSKYSTSDDFLKKVAPSDAIISVGKNSYGHPTDEVLNKLISFGTKVLRTDKKGDIVYRCPDINAKCFLQN